MGIALSRYPRESYKLATKMSNMNYAPGTKVTVESAEQMMKTSLIQRTLARTTRRRKRYFSRDTRLLEQV